MMWSAAAACLLFALLAVGIYGVHGRNHTPVIIGGIVRDYRDVRIMREELAILWPWEYRTVPEQYTEVTLEGGRFYSGGRVIGESFLGEDIGDCEVAGFDSYTEKEYRMSARVRRIEGISDRRMVAVELEGEYYVFKSDAYDPPADFGELLDDYSLEETLRLDHFSVCDDYDETGYYRLEDDRYIWDILGNCRGAKFSSGDTWDWSERSYISFTATSESLGVRNSIFDVTEDGYVMTNVFDWGYVFEIGEDAAARILSYVKENGVETEREAYSSSLAGTLVKITEEYLFVDDSVLCSDPEEGMVFQIPADDLRIRRHIDVENINVGDIVVVHFTGEIDREAGNTVMGAYDLSPGFLSEDGSQVYVNE